MVKDGEVGMRLIDGDTLKVVICASKCGRRSPKLCECGCCDILCLDNAPTIEAVPAWVSVKDKLPEQGKDVLVYIERNAYQSDEIFRKREIAVGWHMDGRWHVYGCSKVVGLYWQELPEPPKEVKWDE